MGTIMMTRWLIVMMLLSSAGGCIARPSRFATPAPDGVPTLSLMTYNVNFGIAGDRATLDAIERPNVDVVLLQEVTAKWERALRNRFSQMYPHQAYHDDDGYASGFAILSKHPIELIDELDKVDWFPATRAVVNSPLGRVQVLNVHLRPPRSNSGSVVVGYFSTRGTREREISSYAGQLDEDLPTFVVGDFNENEWGHATSWLRSRGFMNALPQFSPRANTWRWPVGWFTLRARYDHIFYSDALYPLNATVRNTGHSDHLPVVGVFSLRTAMFPNEHVASGRDQVER